MGFLLTFWGALKFGLFNMAWVFIVLWGIERLWPKDRPPERIQLASLRFWAFYALAGALTATLYEAAKSNFDLSPMVVMPLEEHLPTWAAYIVGPLAATMLYDFFNYWMHRAQHKWFWRQHSIHHSIRHLSAVNSYMHWTEELFRVAFISIPAAVLFKLDGTGATLVSTMISAMHGNFIHSASSINLGVIGRTIFADNRWHRIHHSVEPQHFDKNFATGFPLWDRLFGTAYMPGNEWPAVGVHDMPEPQSVSDYLWRPFRQDRGKAAVGTVYPLSDA